MIRADYKDETLKAIARIVMSSEEFVVCGSRYFGDAKDESDFDFVTENKALIPRLEASGWMHSKSDKKGYLDSNTEAVLQKGKVQIIVVKSLARRLEARAFIVENKLSRHLTESWEKFYKP